MNIITGKHFAEMFLKQAREDVLKATKIPEELIDEAIRETAVNITRHAKELLNNKESDE